MLKQGHLMSLESGTQPLVQHRGLLASLRLRTLPQQGDHWPIG